MKDRDRVSGLIKGSADRNADVVIAGGGASGLAAAVELGMRSPGLRVLVIEKMPEPGLKLRATGSGRCNITNKSAPGFDRIMEFFDQTGLAVKVYPNGLVYPYSESAADVTALLEERASSLGIEIACGEEIISVDSMSGTNRGRDKNTGDMRFQVISTYKDGSGRQNIVTETRYVILATGGKSGPSYGCTGDGYRLARKLGHSIVSPVPALTGIECAEWSDSEIPCAVSLAGTRCRGTVSLKKRLHATCAEAAESKTLFSEAGEIQFTRYGLSGICVFNMTRFMRCDKAKRESIGDFLIEADLFPDGDICEFISDIQKGSFGMTPLRDLLRTVLKEPAARYVIERSDVHSEKPASDLSGADCQEIARNVHSLVFHPVRLRGWKEAQVTSGGVSEDEIDPASRESKIVPGLFITGELSDRDFPCGGFNLSNAWLTGIAVADAIAKDEEENLSLYFRGQCRSV